MTANILADFLTEAQCAKMLGRTVRTLRIWRTQGTGPAYTRIGAEIRYRVDAIREWLIAREVKPVRARRR
jgi:hypothetical protein